MKIFISFLSGIFIFTFAASNLHAQHRNVTVILLRHAEKDLSEGVDSANPPLSEAGNLRAQRLVKIAEKYGVDAVYSTSYIRTKATVTPLARKGRHMILMYEPRNLNQMRDLILSGKYKRILVVGHNNTTPALANLLIGEEKYKTLPESEYTKIFVIKIKRNKTKPNKVKEKVITY
jgi:2,3-bisphosphoglycerate-dependent phosphoglycerate mutase